MRNFILSFVATLIVMFIAPHNTKTIADAPLKDISKKDILPTLEQPVHAQAEKLEQVPVEQPKPVTQPVQASGDCNSWMAQAGIAVTSASLALIAGESGCQPGRLNNSSYACGIAQSLPCTKMYPHATKAWIAANKYQVNGKWFIPNTDPVHELVWMKNYISNRYGTFENAYATWLSRSPHWY